MALSWRSRGSKAVAFLLLSVVCMVGLTACAGETGVSPLESARAQNQARHVAERFDRNPTVLDDPNGLKSSALFFHASETVVVTDSTWEAQVRGASLAVTAHAPLVVYNPADHDSIVAEINRLKALTVVTIGDVALAPSASGLRVFRDPGGIEALHTMTSLEFAVEEVESEEDSVNAVAQLSADPPTWLKTTNVPKVMPAAAALPFPLQSRRDADMAPEVIATRSSSLAAVTNARSFGATVTVLEQPDPRQSERTLFTVAGLAKAPLIALGPEFGTGAELSQRIIQAEQYY